MLKPANVSRRSQSCPLRIISKCRKSCRPINAHRILRSSITRMIRESQDHSAEFRQSIPFLLSELNRSCMKYLEGFQSTAQHPSLSFLKLCKKIFLPLPFAIISLNPLLPPSRDISNLKAWTNTTRPWSSPNTMRLLELQNVTTMRQPLSSMQALWHHRLVRHNTWQEVVLTIDLDCT